MGCFCEIINKPLLLHLVGYLYYWQMGYNSVFKGLKTSTTEFRIMRLEMPTADGVLECPLVFERKEEKINDKKEEEE